jgi:hypothetical protein
MVTFGTKPSLFWEKRPQRFLQDQSRAIFSLFSCDSNLNPLQSRGQAVMSAQAQNSTLQRNVSRPSHENYSIGLAEGEDSRKTGCP